MRCENSESAATTFLTDRPLRQISEDAEEDDNEGMKKCAATRRCREVSSGHFRQPTMTETMPDAHRQLIKLLSANRGMLLLQQTPHRAADVVAEKIAGVRVFIYYGRNV